MCVELEHMQLALDKTCFKSKVPRILCRERWKSSDENWADFPGQNAIARYVNTRCQSVTSSQNSLSLVQVRYIPAKREIRLVKSLGKGQCFREASDVPRASLSFTQALPFPRDITGLISSLAGIYPTLSPCTPLFRADVREIAHGLIIHTVR